jgi:tetratricopeptide (TPR) repeat protein
MKHLTLAAALLAVPGFAFAAGGGNETAPKPTKTSKDCKGVRVWDEKKQRCVRPKKSSLDDQGLYEAVRELAYAGRYHDAQGVLSAMSDQNDDRVLTYMGFTHRKLGNVDTAMMFYTSALEKNPDNMLARSYMGQHFVETGDLDAARLQLAEIETRGGGYTWAGTSLRKAVYQGTTFNY